MDYKRIYVKRDKYLCTESKRLLRDFKDYLGIKGLEYIRVVNIYDLINVDEEEKDLIVNKILKESQLFIISDEPPIGDGELGFRVEPLKGQFNQREDSMNFLVKNFLLDEDKEVLHSKLIILNRISQEDLDRIKSYYINPIEAREVPLESFTYIREEEEVEDVEVIEGFMNFDEDRMLVFKEKYGIGMDMDDLLHCQNYFKGIGRDPYIVEIKLLDTYWSDHCRHTTFMTEITDIEIEKGKYREILKILSMNTWPPENMFMKIGKGPVLDGFGHYQYEGDSKEGPPRRQGGFEEVNAASIEIDVDIDGRMEKWLLMFKNETHNHPTEMEPFGGAATCLGGAIRDPYLVGPMFTRV